jgi:hypothetical protein
VVPGDGFEPPTRGFSIQSKSEQNQRALVSKQVTTKREPIGNVSNTQNETKENPGAASTASGADQNKKNIATEYYTTNLSASMALCVSIVKCVKAEGRVETREILTGALEEYAFDPNLAPLFGIMEHASFCADMATQNEAKAYSVAYYNRLTPANQAAFRDYIGGAK